MPAPLRFPMPACHLRPLRYSNLGRQLGTDPALASVRGPVVLLAALRMRPRPPRLRHFRSMRSSRLGFSPADGVSA
jgi:hypothetical protein